MGPVEPARTPAHPTHLENSDKRAAYIKFPVDRWHQPGLFAPRAGGKLRDLLSFTKNMTTDSMLVRFISNKLIGD
ncbi:hypothetical protein, partial [Cupriavidus sp. CuC1]|uniref:hypothetical protein n=1 Tax=Cupriavidus sp. CuC1 TaxID=3373131 RepID=UPI0037CD5368